MDIEPYSLLFNVLLFSFGWIEFLALILLVLLLICSGLISGSETAFFSLTLDQQQELKSENSVVSNKILNLLSNPSKFLATILISNNLINIGVIVTSEFLLDSLLGDVLKNDYVLFGFIPFSQGTQEFLVTVVLVSFLLVLFGEIAPKVYATLNNLKIAKMMAPTLGVLNNSFTLFTKYLLKTTSLIKSNNSSSNTVSKEDINRAILLTVTDSNDSDATKKEIEMLNSLVRFSDVTAKQIMQPRVNVIALDFDENYGQILQIIKAEGYSRFPIYRDDLDSITGVLYLKDLVPYINEADDFEWQSLIREPLFVPSYKKIDAILTEFKLKKVHMAIVVDEFGGTSGILTLEDIVEEIVGEIRDEFDTDDIDYDKINDNTYVFEGKTLINDVEKIISNVGVFDDVREESDSIAGLILTFFGRIPRKNETFTYNNHTFKVIDADNRRIKKIQLVTPINNHYEPII